MRANSGKGKSKNNNLDPTLKEHAAERGLGTVSGRAARAEAKAMPGNQAQPKRKGTGRTT